MFFTENGESLGLVINSERTGKYQPTRKVGRPVQNLGDAVFLSTVQHVATQSLISDICLIYWEVLIAPWPIREG